MLQRHPGRFESTRRRLRTFRTFIELLSASMVGLDRGIYGERDEIPDEGTTSSMVGPGDPMEWPPDKGGPEQSSVEADEWDTGWPSGEKWISDQESEPPTTRDADLYNDVRPIALEAYREQGHFLRAALTYPNLSPNVRRSAQLSLAFLDAAISQLSEAPVWDDLPAATREGFDQIVGKVSTIAPQLGRKFNLRKLLEALLDQTSDEEERRTFRTMIEILTNFKRASTNRSLPKWLRTGFKQASNLHL